MTELENCLNAVERIVEYTELDHEDLFEESDDDFEDINEFDLKFEKLSLSHGDILRPVVHNVNFQIPQGQRVALVGRSGSGKSTIINSLSGMSRIVQGDIKIGNISLSSVSILNLRKIIKTVPQDVHVFGGTIKDILDPNKEYEVQDIKRVLDDLEIKDQDLDSEVESFGDNLSMALKQELVIAQAILSQPKVLVMDEATSAIEDDRLMIAKLFKICKNLNITLISVVHRLSNITSYDRVLVIGDGRVLEDGKPLELLKKPMGFFSSLYRNSI
jgi:ABC-type multidrug transport system fused ATPase/permease subunit